MKKILCLALLFWGARHAAAQTVLRVEPVFAGREIALDEPLGAVGGDSLVLHTLRFYLGNFAFWRAGALVFAENSAYRLLDLAADSTLALRFDLPEGAGFDSLRFTLGVDSLMTAAGAMGGDLDPTRGMFWAWQSGYINAKIEGFSRKSTARGGAFQFHLGGYLPPFGAAQTVGLPAAAAGRLRLRLDFAPFFEQVDWAKKSSIMSPSAEAVALSRILANSFSVNAE